jgi:hypothetical protein
VDDCVFCSIGRGDIDGDLVARASDHVFTLPPGSCSAAHRNGALNLQLSRLSQR